MCPKDGGGRLLWDFTTRLPDLTASHSWKPKYRLTSLDRRTPRRFSLRWRVSQWRNGLTHSRSRPSPVRANKLCSHCNGIQVPGSGCAAAGNRIRRILVVSTVTRIPGRQKTAETSCPQCPDPENKHTRIHLSSLLLSWLPSSIPQNDIQHQAQCSELLQISSPYKQLKVVTDVCQWVRLDLFNDGCTRGHKTIDVKNEQKEQN